MTEPTLRQRLDEMSGRTTEDIDLHRSRVEGLRAQFKHTIEWVESGQAADDCVTYALGIPFDIFITAAICKIPEEFVTSGLLNHLQPIDEADVPDGSLVLYFREGKFQHAGRLQQCRVISKWGKNPVYRHEPREVPEGYGNDVRYFRQPSADFITRRFIEFVRRHPRYLDLEEVFEGWVDECGYGSAEDGS